MGSACWYYPPQASWLELFVKVEAKRLKKPAGRAGPLCSVCKVPTELCVCSSVESSSFWFAVTSVSKKNKEDKGKKEKKKDKKKDKSANKIEKEEKKESKEKKKEKKSKVKKEKEVEDNSKAPTIPTPTPASSTFAPSHTPSNAASSSSRPTSLSKKPAFLDGLSDSDEEEATPKPPSKATHEQKASSTSSKTSAAGQYEGTPDSVAKALAGLKVIIF